MTNDWASHIRFIYLFIYLFYLFIYLFMFALNALPVSQILSFYLTDLMFF